MKNIMTLINFLMVAIKAVMYLFNKKAMKDAEIKQMEKALNDWGVQASSDPQEIKEKYLLQKEKIKTLLKKNV